MQQSQLCGLKGLGFNNKTLNSFPHCKSTQSLSTPAEANRTPCDPGEQMKHGVETMLVKWVVFRQSESGAAAVTLR
eukprot:2885253-Rhodomonas_salina.1